MSDPRRKAIHTWFGWARPGTTGRPDDAAQTRGRVASWKGVAVRE